MRSIHVLVLFIAMAGVSCSGDTLFQADQEVPNGSWDRAWKPQFVFDITDTVSEQDVFLDIRHTGDYAYSNIYIFASLQGPDARVFTDTVECTLADPTGRWFGKGTGFIFSDRFQAHVLYRMHNRFPRSGRYTFTLEQAMRTGKLDGVIDVGISVERTKQGR